MTDIGTPRPWEAMRRTCSDCATFWGTCGSGPRTAGTRATMGGRTTAGRGRAGTATTGECAVAPTAGILRSMWVPTSVDGCPSVNGGGTLVFVSLDRGAAGRNGRQRKSLLGEGGSSGLRLRQHDWRKSADWLKSGLRRLKRRGVRRRSAWPWSVPRRRGVRKRHDLHPHLWCGRSRTASISILTRRCVTVSPVGRTLRWSRPIWDSLHTMFLLSRATTVVN